MRRRHVFVVSVFIFALTALILAGCGSDSPTDPGGDDPEDQTIWYVDAETMGTGDGKSWDNAFDHPADAMAAASAAGSRAIPAATAELSARPTPARISWTASSRAMMPV